MKIIIIIIIKIEKEKFLCRKIWNGLLPICIARKKIVLQDVRPNCICHAPIPGPTQMADPNRVRDARPCTGTLSDIGISKSYNISKSYTKVQNKTTTVVVFTMSDIQYQVPFTYSKNYTITITDQSAEPTVMNPYSCVGPEECGSSRTSSPVPTRIKNPY